MRDMAFNRSTPLNRPLAARIRSVNRGPRRRRSIDPEFRQGSITATFDVSERGRVENLQLVEANPPEFYDMQRKVQRELKGRLYRPRYENAEPAPAGEQVFTHQYFYTTSDLDEAREESALESTPDEDD